MSPAGAFVAALRTAAVAVPQLRELAVRLQGQAGVRVAAPDVG